MGVEDGMRRSSGRMVGDLGETGILEDTTSIEKLANCCEEISRPRKPWQQTFSEVFGTRWKILWFIPFRQRRPLRVPYHFANHV
uniref:Palmitoyltransferase zdhhc21 n=1 Tax=Sphaerodactylus townsendi TaxID=933632 RepID=A0ACB8ERP1_9SAUR